MLTKLEFLICVVAVFNILIYFNFLMLVITIIKKEFHNFIYSFLNTII